MQRFHLQDEFTDPCAEQSFIAAIAQDCTLYWELFDLLSPNLFTKEAGTWEQVKLAIEEGQRPIVPHDWAPPTAPHAVAHRLADLYRRLLLAALQERVAEALFDEHTPATEIATLLEEETFRVQSAFREPAMGGLLWASDLLPQIIADAEALRQQREHTGCAVLGLPSGIPRLDMLLNGLNVGLHLLGGPPGMGKTTLALQIAAHVSTDVPVVFVTFENAPANLVLKALCAKGGINLRDVRRGEADLQKLRQAATAWQSMPHRLAFVAGSSRLTVAQVRAHALRAMHQHIPQRCLQGGCLLELTGEVKVGRRPIPSASAKRQTALVRYVDSISQILSTYGMEHQGYARNAGAVYSLKYHLVFCPKDRKAVLGGPVAARLKELLQAKAQELGITLHTMEVMPDHVHLCVESDPGMAPAKLAAQLQGYTSRLLRQECRFLRSQLPSLWSRSYCMSSVGRVSEATGRRYIAEQKTRHAVSVLTSKYRIKDSTSRTHLGKMSGAIHSVWNSCQEVSLLAFRRDKTLLSPYDLHTLTAGTSKDLRLSADTIQQVCTEYVTRRTQFKKRKLKWRSKKRSLGWIPFKAAYIQLQGDTVTSCGHRFRLWLSRPVEGTVKTGSFTQDARGRWYVNVQCDVPDATEHLGQAEIGINLGLINQIACSDGVVSSRENRTRAHEDALAMAQRAHKKRRVKAIQATIANTRSDWTHQATTAIARRARLIVIGDVSRSTLITTPFATSTLAAAWYSVRFQLTYKANRLAGICVSGRETFSSVTCSDCGTRSGPSGRRALGVRAWICPHCGSAHERDVNAARNILRLRTGRGTPTQGIRLL